MTNAKLQAGSWVAVPGQFKPAQISFSQNSRTHYVVLEELRAKPDGKHDILKLRHPSFEGLRQEIVRRFPRATFSVTNGGNPISRTESGIALDTRTDEAKGSWNAEKTAFLENAAAEHANRQRLETMQPLERQTIINEHILEFMKSNEWLVANPSFFTWGPNQENYKVMLAYFGAMGWELPTVEQCGHAFRWLWDANYLHKQQSYRRSEDYLRPRQFDPSVLQPTTVSVTAEQLATAKKKLLIFNGRRITNEMALTQISQAELDAINQEAALVKVRSTDDLKAEVVGSRRIRTRRDLASDSRYL